MLDVFSAFKLGDRLMCRLPYTWKYSVSIMKLSLFAMQECISFCLKRFNVVAIHRSLQHWHS